MPGPVPFGPANSTGPPWTTTAQVGASLALTGTPTAPTATALTDSTQIATTAYADLAVAAAAWSPTDQGMVGWTFDPAVANSTQITPAAGDLYIAKIRVPKACTVTNIVMSLATAGSTLTSGRNFAGLYGVGAGASLLSATADQTTPWQTAGLITMALTTPQSIAAGVFQVGFYATGTTLPTWRVGASGSSWPNAGLATTAARFGLSTTGLTTALPGTLAAISAVSFPWWVGLS